MFPLSQVRLLPGIFQERQATHARFLASVEPDRLLAGFREQAGLTPRAPRYGGWESRDIAGHSLGHYLSALAHLSAATDAPWVHPRVAHIVDELALCQQAHGDGYALPVPKAAFADVRAGRITASPFALNGIWVPFYTLHKVLAGLRDAYRLTGYTPALGVARSLAVWLADIVGHLSPTQIQEMLRTEHGGMNEVLADLASDTGEASHLRVACDCFHHAVVLDPLFRGEDRLDGLHGNTQIPKVVGLAREYELTAEPRFRRAAETFWDRVVHHRSYANGGHGESEHFFPPAKFPERLTPYTAETCNSYNLLKLTRHLFAWQPRAAHMDFVERALLNHLLANLGRAPGEFGYFLGLGAVGVKAFSTPFDSWWCCVGTGMENPTRYTEQLYARSSDALWINLYLPSTLTWPERGITLRQETRFPDGDTVRVTFTCGAPTTFALRLRHPHWCPQLKLTLNDAAVDTSASTPSSYFTLERTWHDGDSLELHLPMPLRVEPLPHSDDKIVALFHGPCLLAAVVPPAPDKPDPAKQRFTDHLSARGKTDAFPPHLIATGVAELLAGLRPTGGAFGEFRSTGVVAPADLTFVPFHRIYEEHYAVYFPRLTPTEWTQREAGIRAARAHELRRQAAVLDVVTPGFQQSEIEHGVRGERTETGDFLDRKWRDARDGGWFSYTLAVAPDEPVHVVATYWGGEWVVRQFDVVVDDVTVATQRLRTNQPGDFFNVTYPLPPALTAGKTSVTVRFQAHPSETAGGLFGVRTVRANLAASIHVEP